MKYFIFDDLYGARWTFDLRQGWVRFDGQKWIKNTPSGPLASIFTNEEFLEGLIPSDIKPGREIESASVSPAMTQCKSCSAELPENAKFCPNCAAPVPPPEPVFRICPNCGTQADIGKAKFCIECGSSFEEPKVEVTPEVPKTVIPQPQGIICPHCKSMNMGDVSTCMICKKPLGGIHETAVESQQTTTSQPIPTIASAPAKPEETKAAEPSSQKTKSKKSGCGPGTFAVLLIILLLAAAASYMIPKVLNNFSGKTESDAEDLFNQAEKLWEGNFVDGDVNQMEQLLLDSADKGHGEAMFRLGIIYMDGLEDIDADPSEARRWFQDAIDADFDQAYNLLAEMYANGEGGRKNQEKAIELWRKSAETGDVSAMYTLGMYFLYEMPDSEEIFFDEGIYWLNEAAHRGSSDAQSELNYLDEGW